MAALTIAELFGDDAVLNTETRMLTIELSDFADVGLDTAEPTATQIFAGLILKLKMAMTSNSLNDSSVGLTVGEPFKNFLTRGSENHIGYQFDVVVYTPDQTAMLDPDEVV